jgi:hypothetical protein
MGPTLAVRATTVPSGPITGATPEASGATLSTPANSVGPSLASWVATSAARCCTSRSNVAVAVALNEWSRTRAAPPKASAVTTTAAKVERHRTLPTKRAMADLTSPGS